MLKTLKLSKPYKALKPFDWKAIPAFSVISGENGSGKTALLELINGASNSKAKLGVESPELGGLSGKIKYIAANFSPSDVAQNAQNAEQQIAQKSKQMVQQIKVGPANTPILQKLRGEVLKVLKKNAERKGEDSSQLELRTCSDEEILDALPADFSAILQDYQNNEFISEVFVNYLKIIERKKLELFDDGKIASENSIIDEIGTRPPWELINSLLAKYKFSYRINVPIRGMTYIPHFERQGLSEPVAFNSLSSGEQILVTLVLWAFNSRAKLHKSLFLLDEFDAHLNPALSKMMIELIEEQLVGKFGLQVIMTTHSPSTVAHAPEQALFWMEKELPIKKVSKQEAISRLSNGFMVLQHDQVSDIFHIQTTEKQKPFLCVEGVTDKLILTEAWSKLKPDSALPVVIRDVFDCYFLTNMFKRGNIFANYPDATFFGLLDYDDAFTNARRSLSDKDWSEDVDEESGQVIFDHRNGRGRLFTLPVPSFRDAIAGPKIRNPYLSIELLFEDQHVAEFCRMETVAGGASIPRFKDNRKMSFAQKVEGLPAESFNAFLPLLSKIEEWASA